MSLHTEGVSLSYHQKINRSISQDNNSGSKVKATGTELKDSRVVWCQSKITLTGTMINASSHLMLFTMSQMKTILQLSGSSES